MVHFLSVKPHISLSQKLKPVQVLLREVEDDVGLSRDMQNMHPHKGVEPPPRGGVLDAVAFVVRKSGLVVLERVAHAVLSGRRDEPTDGHHHSQGHDTLGLFEIEGGGQKWRGFEEATSTFRPGLPLIAVEHRLGR